MKTDELIGLLAADAGLHPAARHAGERRLAPAVLAGLLLALLWVQLVHGIRADLGAVWATGPFLVKLGMPLAVAAVGVLAVFRLAHPGMRLGAGLRTGLWLPVLLLWVLAGFDWAGAPPQERAALVWGSTWRSCSVQVVLTALPVGAALLVALRGLAPTRPVLAGAAAGWLAGALGAAAYALHCPEMTTPFLAVWYVAGMLVCAALGAAAGARWLRW